DGRRAPERGQLIAVPVQLGGRGQHADRGATGVAATVRRPDVRVAGADPPRREEYRESAVWRRLTGVLEQVGAPKRDVGAGDDQVEVAVAVVVHRQEPSPQTR